VLKEHTLVIAKGIRVGALLLARGIAYVCRFSEATYKTMKNVLSHGLRSNNLLATKLNLSG